MKNIKRLSAILIILVWFITTSLNDKSSWYVEFYSDDNTIHKCPRDKYLEYKDLLLFTPKNDRIDLMFYYAWEPDYRKSILDPIKYKTTCNFKTKKND